MSDAILSLASQRSAIGCSPWLEAISNRPFRLAERMRLAAWPTRWEYFARRPLRWRERGVGIFGGGGMGEGEGKLKEIAETGTPPHRRNRIYPGGFLAVRCRRQAHRVQYPLSGTLRDACGCYGTRDEL